MVDYGNYDDKSVSSIEFQVYRNYPLRSIGDIRKLIYIKQVFKLH